MRKVDLPYDSLLEPFECIGTRGPRNQVYWRCHCSCGNDTTVTSERLLSGHTISCGCLHKQQLRERSIVHGLRKTSEYRSWANMKTRCYNQNRREYPRYGGRGIEVCDRWKNSFSNFYDDMGPKPGPEYSIERIDNDGNYEPGNCKWATGKEQSNNRECTLRLDNGQPLSEWCKENNRSYWSAIGYYNQGISSTEQLSSRTKRI